MKTGDYVRLNHHATSAVGYYEGCGGWAGVIVQDHGMQPNNRLVQLSNGWSRWCDDDVHLEPATEREYLIEVACHAMGVE